MGDGRETGTKWGNDKKHQKLLLPLYQNFLSLHRQQGRLQRLVVIYLYFCLCVPESRGFSVSSRCSLAAAEV
jgi:hypothetical protein